MRILKSKIPLIIIFVTVFIALFFITVLGFSSFHVISKEENQPEKDSYMYQVLEVNPTTNEASLGVVSIFDHIPPGEFISYKDDVGNYVLISHLGDQEYECHGTCYCEDEWRRNSIAKSKGFFYLVAAFSSAVAINIARDHFQEQAEVEMKDVCPTKNSIKCKVDGCDDHKTIGIKESMPEAPASGDQMVQVRMADGQIFANYWCKGNCQWNYKKYTDNFDKKVDDECKAYVMEKDVIIKSKMDADLKEEKLMARKAFAHQHLIPFCKEQQPLCFGKIIGCRQVGISTFPEGKGITKKKGDEKVDEVPTDCDCSGGCGCDE